jgi:hypothetical protein
MELTAMFCVSSRCAAILHESTIRSEASLQIQIKTMIYNGFSHYIEGIAHIADGGRCHAPSAKL